jgi:hypothetical protein
MIYNLEIRKTQLRLKGSPNKRSGLILKEIERPAMAQIHPQRERDGRPAMAVDMGKTAIEIERPQRQREKGSQLKALFLSVCTLKQEGVKREKPERHRLDCPSKSLIQYNY